MSGDDVYRTGYTKNCLYWAFCLEDDGVFDFEGYFEALTRVTWNHGDVKLYRDHYTKNVRR